jgi:hypothetical protein
LSLAEFVAMRRLQGDVTWWHAAALGASVALIVSGLWGIWRALTLLTGGLGTPSEWRDGRRVTVYGNLHPDGEPLTAPLSGKPVVFYEYEVTRSRDPQRRNTRGATRAQLAHGMASSGCSLRALGREPITVLGFLPPQHVTQSPIDDDAPARLATHLLALDGLEVADARMRWSDLKLGAHSAEGFQFDRAAAPLAELVLGERITRGLAAAETAPENADRGKRRWGFSDESSPDSEESDEDFDDEDPVPLGAVQEFLDGSTAHLHFGERLLEVGDRVTVVGTWRARERAVDLGRQLQNLTHRISRRSPQALFATDFAGGLAVLVLWTTVSALAHLAFFPALATLASERLPVIERLQSVVTHTASRFGIDFSNPGDSAVQRADAAKGSLPDPRYEDDPSWLVEISADVRGALREINVGDVRFVDGLAFPASADAYPDGQVPGLSLWFFERSLAAELLAAESPCAEVHTRALLRLRGAHYAHLLLDSAGKPVTLEFGTAGGPSVKAFALGGRDLSAKVERTSEGRVEGRLRHRQWGKIRFSIPLAENQPERTPWMADEATEDLAVAALQALRDAARNRDLATVLVALELPRGPLDALQRLPSLGRDLEAYDELFLDPTAPVQVDVSPERITIGVRGRSPSGAEFSNFAHFAPCDGRPVLVQMAVNPQ